MEEKSTLARPYATAVFEQASEESDFESWSQLLQFLEAIVTDRAMAGIIADPRVAQERLTKLMLDLCEGRLTKSGENFVRVLVEARRLSLAPSIRTIFERLRSEQEGQSRIHVISAFELDQKLEQVITGAMAKRFGRAIEMTSTVDNSLIGGIIIRAGDLVIDLSLRGRLNQLALTLA